MDCITYKNDFDRQRAALELPEDCDEIEPTVDAVGFYIWTLIWFLIFKDGHYLRVWERWEKRRGLDIARRLKYAYHYGQIVIKDAAGVPEHKGEDPVDIRIDNSSLPFHLHYGAQNPHYSQNRVQGLNLESLELFTFIKAILKHRSTGKPIDRVLGFKIV